MIAHWLFLPMVLAGGPLDWIEQDKKNLQGRWTVASIVEDGLPNNLEFAGVLELVFSGDALEVVIEGRTENVFYKLEPRPRPKHIDLFVIDPQTGQKKPAFSPWIYEIRGDDLKIGCVLVETGNEKSVGRPADFSAPGTVVIGFKRK